MLDELISKRRAWILERWLERILLDYPAESATFLRDQQDRFANPMGHVLRNELGGVLDGTLSSASQSDLRDALDRVIRVRAVQDLPPSRAVSFVLELKPLIRSAFEERGPGVVPPQVLRQIDQRVDRLALAAFDVYMACREQLCSIRVDEIRNRSLKTMERLQAWQEARAARSDADGGKVE